MTRAAVPEEEPVPRRGRGGAVGSGATAWVGPILGSLFYFAVTCRLAATRPLWTDEVITFHLARLPRWADLGRALADGPDPAAPLNTIAVRVVYRLIGEGELATRLPAIVGVWLMAAGLFAVVARRCAAPFAWAATLLPLSTIAYTYAYEGRAYGLWLGLTALSVLCWQRACEGVRRPLALAGLAASLAAGVACHYYAVLVLLALGLGELARWRVRRAIDPLCGLAIAAGLVPVAFIGPLLANARAYARAFRPPPYLNTLVATFPWLLEQMLPGLVAGLVVYILGAEALRRRPGHRPEPPRAAFPAHELVAAVGLVALPGFGVILALTVTHAFIARYALPAVIGCGLLLAALASRIEERTLMARALTLGLGLWFVATACGLAARASGQIAALRADLVALQRQGSEAGLVVASHDAHAFLPAHHYAPDGLRPDLVYLVGLADTLDELMLRKLQPWTLPDRPLRVAEIDAFLARHDRFLLLTESSAGLDPALRARLRSHGASIELAETRGRLAVYAVSLRTSRQ